MPENGESKRYPTWRWLVAIAIMLIGFLLSKGFDLSIARSLAQDKDYKELRIAQQITSERVTRLESGFEYIMAGISELKLGQEKVVDTLARHEQKGQ